MERLTRRNILGVASAVAGGALAAVPAVAAAATYNGSKLVDPIIALIAEERRLRGVSCRISDRADTILYSLPQDIQKSPCVLLPVLDPERPSDRQRRFLSGLIESEQLELTRPHRRPFASEDDLLKCIRAAGIEPERGAAIVAEWRAHKARIDRVRDAAGYTALRQQADTIMAQADEAVGSH